MTKEPVAVCEESNAPTPENVNETGVADAGKAKHGKRGRDRMYSYSTYFLSSPMSLLMHIGRRMRQRAQPRLETVLSKKEPTLSV
jgi:hypothetical protein